MNHAADLTRMSGTKYNSIYQRFVKRGLDIALCILFLPLVSFASLMIAAAIKIDDHGPVIYHSKRIGKDFREFDMLKFRSMKVNAPDLRNEDGSTYNSKTDERVTRLGRFLRESSADEIIQIYNVLRGDMSIVGPRPGDVESKDTYADDEKDKTLVRPGILGYTQVYYRNSLGVREKRLCDAWYAHNVTLLLDVQIILKSLGPILRRENIYTNAPEPRKEKSV